jgi:L-asparagine oxygenase
VDIIQTLSKDGFVDLGEFMVDTNVATASEQVAARLACKVWRTPELLSANQVSAKPANTYGGNYGMGALPRHTDLAHWHVPPRYLMLRCKVGDPSVETPLVHRREALRGLAPAVIQRALFRPRRRLDGKMYLLRLLQGEIFRWDRLFLTADNPEAQEVKAALTALEAREHGTAIRLGEPGRTLIIDNWAMMHGRSAVPDSATSRRIQRAYFSEVADGQ